MNIAAFIADMDISFTYVVCIFTRHKISLALGNALVKYNRVRLHHYPYCVLGVQDYR